MNHFEELSKEVEDGILGKSSGIPTGFGRLNNYMTIRKATYYLIGGYTGSGKTSLLDDAFVLNPLDHVITSNEVDMEIIYFSMERKKNFKLAKWICRKIFLDTGNIIPLNRMMGWVDKTQRLTKNEHDLFLSYESYISALMSKITIIEGPQNPTGVRKYIDDYALRNGTLDTSDKYNHKYYPNDPNKVVEIISDHIGLTKLEKELNTKKAAIDKSSEDKQKFRDLYGFSPIDVSQFNRDISNPARKKAGDVDPMLEDFKDTGSTQENADVVLSLFDPYRYNVPDVSGYKIDKFRNEAGAKKYRNLKILKNSYGSDDIRIGLAFQPEIGLFKELPKLKDIRESDYEDVMNNKYFL